MLIIRYTFGANNFMTQNNELVVLVDDNDVEIGTALKATVHTHDTPLHRAFSIYIFNPNGQVLVQQRRRDKITWGSFWSNSCCGHPCVGESREDAAKRRPLQELGINVNNIEQIEWDRYRFEHNNIVENEICPIFVGITRDEVKPNDREIEDYKWLSWSGFLQDMTAHRDIYSPWSQEQVVILNNSENFKSWLAQNSLMLS